MSGLTVELTDVVAIRRVEYVHENEDEPFAECYRVVFEATPVGGEIQDCKRSGAAGNDDWRAGWFKTLHGGITPPPEAGPRADLELIFGE